MRTRLPHLTDTWMFTAGAVALFTDAIGRIIVPGWGDVSDWAGWLLLGAFFVCHYKFAAHHHTDKCGQCPSTDPEGKDASRRYRWCLRALHALTPLALLIHRLGGSPLILGVVLFMLFLVAPIFLLAAIAPDGFATAFIFTYLTLLRTVSYQHARLQRWCPWCRGGGGGGGGDDGEPDPDPDPVPSSKRSLTLAA